MPNTFRLAAVLSFAAISFALAAPAAGEGAGGRSEKIRALLETLKPESPDAPPTARSAPDADTPDLSLPGDRVGPAAGTRPKSAAKPPEASAPPAAAVKPAASALPEIPPLAAVPAGPDGRVEIARERLRAALLRPDDVYRIGPGDEIDLNVFETVELSKVYTVSPDGSIMVPLAGRVTIAGLTVEEASEAVRAKLRAMFNNPQVAVTVKTHTNNFVILLGRVSKPGRFDFKGRPTLLELFSLAGGILPVGESPYSTTYSTTRSTGVPRGRYGPATIFRGTDQIIEVDLDRLFHDGQIDLNLPLQSGDVVNVPLDHDRVYVLGQVMTPGVYTYERDMTLLDALSFAGNSRGRADLKRVRVIRRERGRERVIVFNVADALRGKRQDRFTLEPGDIVYVPSTGVEKFLYTVGWVNTSLSTIVLGNTVAKMAAEWD